MTKHPKNIKDEIYLSCPSTPEAIRLERTENPDNPAEKAILRFGFQSKKNEISFDVNKILTLSMLEDLEKGLNKLIKDLKKEANNE